MVLWLVLIIIIRQPQIIVLSHYKLGCLKVNSTNIQMKPNEVYGVISTTDDTDSDIMTTPNVVYGVSLSQ